MQSGRLGAVVCSGTEETTVKNGSEMHQTGEVVEIKIVWPETVKDLPTIYANQLLISHAGPEFFLVFGIVTPPVPPADREPDLGEMDALEVSPVVKIAVSAEAMLAMAGTIKTNVERYRESKRLRDSEVSSRG